MRATVKDVHDHPCEAMRSGVTMVPTIVAETPAGTVRARGHPPEEAVADIIGDEGAGRPPSHTRPSSDDVKSPGGKASRGLEQRGRRREQHGSYGMATS